MIIKVFCRLCKMGRGIRMNEAFQTRVQKERRRSVLLLPLFALLILASVVTDTPVYQALQAAKTVTAWGGASAALLVGTLLEAVRLTRALRDPAKLAALEEKREKAAVKDDSTPATDMALNLVVAGMFLSMLVSRTAMCVAFVVGIVVVSIVWNLTRRKT